MTKKHFIAIANIINKTRNTATGTIASDKLVLELAEYFQSDNKNFNPATFLMACGKK